MSKYAGAVSEWKVSGKRGLWIKVASLHSSLVPLLTEVGELGVINSGAGELLPIANIFNDWYWL